MGIKRAVLSGAILGCLLGTAAARYSASDAIGAILPANAFHEEAETSGVYVLDPFNGQKIYQQIALDDKNVSVFNSRIPYLLDRNTSHADVQVFSGRLTGPAGQTEPVAIMLEIMPLATGNKPVQTIVSHRYAETGPNGEFNFAFKETEGIRKRSIRLHVREFHGSTFTGKAHEEFGLSSEKSNELKWKSAIHTFSLTLLSTDDKPYNHDVISLEPTEQSNSFRIMYDLRRPSVFGNLYYQDRGISALRQSDDLTKPINWSSVNGSRKLLAHNVAVPGRYVVRAIGRLFAEKHLTADDQHCTFTEVSYPFTVSGRVTDIYGKPVPNAVVELVNPDFIELLKSKEEYKNCLETSSPKMPLVHMPYIIWGNLRTPSQMRKIARAAETGAFEPYALYACTNDMGEWTIKGESMPSRATLSLFADGFQSVLLSGFVKSDKPGRPRWDDLLSGDYQTTVVKLLHQAKLRIKADSESTKTLSWCSIYVSNLGGVYREFYEGEAEAWGNDKLPGRFVLSGDSFEMVVPAGVPLEINIIGKSIRYRLPAIEPLDVSEIHQIDPIDFNDKQNWVDY